MEEKIKKLKKFYYQNRRFPSYSEIAKLFNFSSKNSVFKFINKLVNNGFLKKEERKLAPTSKFFSLPILGLVKAGYPILAEENKNYLSLDEYLIGDPTSSFLLRVSGDSLAGIGIFDGDYVIIEKKKNALPGDIVLAEIDKEWTLKIFKKDRQKRKVYLQAANPKYPPLYPRHQLEIFGIVKAVIRKIRN
ncbi:MAG: transcriptional repressor LexA [Patescibacteria group bacterium]|nr:transcriptional repressor LexA [Patescibacteria group bacterium]